MKAECPDGQSGSVVDNRDYHKSGIRFPRTTVREHNEAGEIGSMPAKAAWLLHIPEIVSQLDAFDVPVVDRASVERLFALRRRQAIELMHRFGGYQAGRTFLIDRRMLIDRLRRCAEGEEFQSENRRRERLQDAVDQLRRNVAAARVRIPTPPAVPVWSGIDLSDGVALEPGHLHISFHGTEDLLSKLYALSQAAASDFVRFQALTVETPPNRAA
jgi:hypothetical protein